MQNPPSSVVVMDEAEARLRTEAIRGSVNQIRSHLLAIYQRKGWQALGYRTYGDYLDAEFTEYSTSYLRRQTHAALLEWKLSESDELVGTHKESHLRPLTEMLPDVGAQALAYYLTLDRVPQPTARDFHRIAAEVYVYTRGDPRIVERFKAGSLGAQTAYLLCKECEKLTHERDFDLLVVIREISDLGLVPLLRKLRDRGSETWQEILLAGVIPSFPEPIPLANATVYNLMAWLDVASAEHKAIARLAKQVQWDERKAATEELILAVRLFLDAQDIKSRATAEVGLRSAFDRYENVTETQKSRG